MYQRLKRAATISQDAILKVFENVKDPIDQAEIKRTSVEVKNKYNEDLLSAAIGGARAKKFKMHFKKEYRGTMYPDDAANIGYDYYTITS